MKAKMTYNRKYITITSVIIIVSVAAIAAYYFFFMATPTVQADMNGDGLLNIDDVDYLQCHLSTDPSCATLYANGDVNCDGNVNSADCLYLARHIEGYLGYEKLYC
jgi:hypothetical protein